MGLDVRSWYTQYNTGQPLTTFPLSEMQFRLWLDFAGSFIVLGGGAASPACNSLIGLDRRFEKLSSVWSREKAIPIVLCCTLFRSLREH